MEKESKTNPPEITLGWDQGRKVTIGEKRYQVTESQFQELIEHRLEAMLFETISFESDEAKRDFIQPGNILTFKNPIPGFPSGQIAIAKILRDKLGVIQLTNSFGTHTPWFGSEQELIEAIDWEWMQQNIIMKQ
jgi:putative aminopeptidase FrvX